MAEITPAPKILHRQHNPEEMLTSYCEVSRWRLTEDQMTYWCLRYCVDQYAMWQYYDQVMYMTDTGDTWRFSTESTPVRPYVSEHKRFSWYWLLRYEDHIRAESRGYQTWLKWYQINTHRIQKHIELIGHSE